jgi:hypothetical protein
MWLTFYLYLALRIMSTVAHLLHTCAFILCTVATLPFHETSNLSATKQVCLSAAEGLLLTCD